MLVKIEIDKLNKVREMEEKVRESERKCEREREREREERYKQTFISHYTRVDLLRKRKRKEESTIGISYLVVLHGTVALHTYPRTSQYVYVYDIV